MNDIEIKQYIVNGGEIFTVKSIDTIRDGGTKVLNTTKGEIYICANTKQFHLNYPLSNENLIKDSILMKFLIYQIEVYIKRCVEDIERDKNLLTEIKFINEN